MQINISSNTQREILKNVMTPHRNLFKKVYTPLGTMLSARMRSTRPSSIYSIGPGRGVPVDGD